jgi:hypothetical protein
MINMGMPWTDIAAAIVRESMGPIADVIKNAQNVDELKQALEDIKHVNAIHLRMRTDPDFRKRVQDQFSD